MNFKTTALFLLLAATLSQPVMSDEASLAAATDDANSAVDAMMNEQEQDLRDYVRMFMGHSICEYAFPDEVIFNDIADTALKNMALNTKAFLAARDHQYFSSMSDDQQDYVANIMTQTVIGSWATELSAVIAEEISADPGYCVQALESDQAIYIHLSTTILGK